MKNFILKKYETKHSRIMCYRDHKEFEYLMNLNPYTLDNREGYTILDLEKTPICFLLWGELTPSTVLVNFFPSIFIDSLWCPEIRKLMNQVVAELKNKYIRIEATVDCKSPRNIRFAKKTFGMEIEGIAENYDGYNRPFYHMAWVKDVIDPKFQDPELCSEYETV